MDGDPIVQFFPGEEDVDLYSVLTLSNEASSDSIKKAYRRLALKYHPDKQGPAADKTASSLKFQQIGYAYTVLSDDKRRQRYDQTGRTDEGIEGIAGEAGWNAYFEEIFEQITRHKLDEMKREYQGSSEEVEDLKQAYTDSQGSIAEMMTRVPHSTFDDEARFIVIISKLIDDDKLPSLSNWKSSVHDEKAKLVRKKQADKEAAEAEGLARELGVWDEFYGSGKSGKRQGKGKATSSQKDNVEEEDLSALQALILKKKQKTGSFLDSLAAKYVQEDDKAHKRRSAGSSGASGSRKRAKPSESPDIDDEEFKKLQDKLFSSGDSSADPKPRAKRQKRR